MRGFVQPSCQRAGIIDADEQLSEPDGYTEDARSLGTAELDGE